MKSEWRRHHRKQNQHRRAAPIAKEGDWSKPAAMAIPKGGAFKQEQGRYGLIYPRTPANYGFSILAKVKPGREAAVREYGNTIEKAVADDSGGSCAAQTALPALGAVRNQRGHVLHVSGHLRHRLRQVHRGRRGALRFDWHHDGVHKSRRVPRELARQCARDRTSFSGNINAPASWSMRNTLMRPPMRSRKL